MKKLVTVIMFGASLFSCESDFDKKLKEVEGGWNIERVSYFDGTKIQTKEGTLGKVIFGETSHDGIQYDRHQGLQVVDGKEFKIDLSVDISGQKIDIAIPDSIKKDLPIAALGRVQVYNFNLVKPNKLEIFTDKELDYSTNRVITDVRYTLVR